MIVQLTAVLSRVDTRLRRCGEPAVAAAGMSSSSLLDQSTISGEERRPGSSSRFTWRTPANTSASSMWEGIEFLVHLTPAPTLLLSNGHCWSAGGGVEGGVEEEEEEAIFTEPDAAHSLTHTLSFIARDTLRYGELSLPTSVDPGLPLWKPLGWWSGLAAVEMSRTL